MACFGEVGERSGGTDAGEHVELASQAHEPVLLLGRTVGNQVVVLSASDRTTKDTDARPCSGDCLVPTERAMDIPGLSTDEIVLEIDSETMLCGNGLQDTAGLFGYLRPDAVPRQNQHIGHQLSAYGT